MHNIMMIIEFMHQISFRATYVKSPSQSTASFEIEIVCGAQKSARNFTLKINYI